ncbi:hypothetical protein [Haloarcula litorea]|uniref:hypothetical protein n=1 Tax=Haloarcula litorea TaxID=3032579 RepID=UPI0023E769D0|nr:hypothetical protein [Halomicroarcula sp. GDY20]
MNLTGGTAFSGELRFELENVFPEAHYKKAIDQAFRQQAQESLRTDGGQRTEYFWSGEDGILYHTEFGEDIVNPFFGSVEEAEQYLERQADRNGKERYEGLVLRKSGNQKVEEATEVLTEQSGLDQFATDGGRKWFEPVEEYWQAFEDFDKRHTPRYVDPGKPVDHDTVDYFPHRHFQQNIREFAESEEEYRDLLDVEVLRKHGIEPALE